MAVIPTQIPVSTTVPALTLAAGTTGGVAVASTIDAVNDYLLVYTASATATQGINRNTLLGLASAPVGLTDSQTLTNKILTSPNVSNPVLSGTLSGTYTIGGTPTFPASVMTLTGTQTATNKTFTQPTINQPTITNATISADALTGFTTTNTGTVYGLSVTGGTISGSSLSASSISSTQLANASVTSNKLATGAATALVATSQTATSTSYGDLATTGPAVTVTIGANGLALVCLSASMTNSSAGGDGALTSFAISGATTMAAGTSPYILFYQTWTTSSLGEFGATWLVTGLTPGSTTFTVKYAAFSGGTAGWKDRSISVVPL